MTKQRITRASAKAKGRSLQQWTAAEISNVTGHPYGPDEMIASRESAQSGVDIRLVGPAAEDFSYAVECKWQESWSVPAFIRQARKGINDKLLNWIVVMKRSRESTVVVLDAVHFFDLYKELLERRRGTRT